MTGKFRLLTLGPPELLAPGSSGVDLALGKPFALLVYIALEPDPTSRDDLARMFWPEAPRERARQSTRQALWLLRRTLGPDAFESDDPVALVPGLLSVDVADVRTALATGDVHRAIGLWRGPFLERFAVSGTRAWQHWVDEQRDAVADELGAALYEAAVRERDGGRLGAAVTLLRKAVQVAPHFAVAHGLLIDVLLDVREYEAAGAAIADARRQFGDGTRSIDFERFDHRLAAARTASGRGRSGPELSTEFVGRAAELADLLGLWARARTGHTSAAVVSGPTGIGKSRLAAEVALAADDGAVVTVKASEAERDIEHGLVATLVRRLLRLRGAAGVSGASDAVLRALVPSLANGNHHEAAEPGERRSLGPAAPVATVALTDAVADLVGAVADESPLLIILDDLQWVDHGSRAVIASLRRRLRDAPCLFLATARPEDAGPDFSVLLRALEEEHAVTRYRLEPLGVAEVSELLGLMAEFPDAVSADRIAKRLHAVTGGNPLFLVELVRALHEDGVVESRDGHWTFHADRLPDELALPASVHAVVDRRLDRISPDAAVLAGHLARLPRGGPLATLRQRAGLSEGAFTRAAGELLDRDVARWADDERFEFTHDQLREGAARRFPVDASRSETDPSGRHRTRRRRALLVAILAIFLVPAALFAWRETLGLGARPLYGGGELYFQANDTLFTARPPHREGGSWTVHSAPGLDPGLALRRATPFYGADGRRVWVQSVAVLGRPQSTRLLSDAGRELLVLRDSGDVAGGAVSPDGRFVTYFRDPAVTEDYDWQLMLSRTDGSSRSVVAGPAPSVSFGAWAPAGGLFSARIRALARDTIVVFNLDLARVATIPLPGPDLIAPAWCAADRIVTQVVVTDRPQLAVINPWTGNVRVLEGPGPETDRLACSPDGSVVVYSALVSGRFVTVLRNLEDGRYRVLDLRRHAVVLNWLPLQPVALPVAVEIRSPASLEAGDTLRLEAVTRGSDGHWLSSPVRWRSLHEQVLSIDSLGIATANRPGHAIVVATTTNWIADTVGIDVLRGNSSEDPAIDEHFASLDTTRWIVVGDAAAPWPVMDEGEPALRLTGDGQYQDGLYLRQPLSLPLGATLEAEFRLDLTRWDRQSYSLCLGDMSLPPGETGRSPLDWITHEVICFRYPAFLQTTSDPARAQAAVGSLIRYPDVTPDLPSSGWTHVAIQVRPDGQVDFFVNRRRVQTAPTQVENLSSREWRIIVAGESVGTGLYVRDLALWQVPRY